MKCVGIGWSVVTLILVTCATAEEPTSYPDNAALYYWQAFAMMPRLSPEEQKSLNFCLTSPLDDKAQTVIQKGKATLKLLRQGAACEYCNWQVNEKDGVDALMPHLSKTRDAVRLVLLQARWSLKQGNASEAIDDFITAMKLGRDIGRDGPLIAYLVQVAVESMTIQAVTDSLPALDRKSLAALAEKLKSLREGPSLSRAFKNEKKFLDQQKENPLYPSAVELWKDLSEIADLPPEEFERRIQQMKNPALKPMVPAIANVSYTQAAFRTKKAMLQAAILVLLEGREKLASVRDPYGDGSFRYKKLPNGFELEGQLQVKGKPVCLTVEGSQ